jgi:DNA-binding beta-propeller fold protein YncE
MFTKAPIVKYPVAIAASLTLATSAVWAQEISLTRLNRVTVSGPKASVTANAGLPVAPKQTYPIALGVNPKGIVYSVATEESYDEADIALVGGSTSPIAPAFTSQGMPMQPKPIAGQGMSGLFKDPHGLAFDKEGNFYVADAGKSSVSKLSPSGKLLTQFGLPGSGKAELNHPYGVAVDPSGDIYVADTNNHRIVKLSPNGDYLLGWGTRGSKEGQFFFPQALTLDRSGYVYVADFANNRIQKFTNDGTFVTAWGEAGSKPGQFNYPSSLAIDPQNHVWVTDLMNHRLQVFTPDGGLIATIGSFGANAAGATEFNFPRSIAFTPNGDLWLAQPGVHAVDQYRVSFATATASR